MIILFFHTCTQLNKVNTLHHPYPNKRLCTVNSITSVSFFNFYNVYLKTLFFLKTNMPRNDSSIVCSPLN